MGADTVLCGCCYARISRIEAHPCLGKMSGGIPCPAFLCARCSENGRKCHLHCCACEQPANAFSSFQASSKATEVERFFHSLIADPHRLGQILGFQATLKRSPEVCENETLVAMSLFYPLVGEFQERINRLPRNFRERYIITFEKGRLFEGKETREIRLSVLAMCRLEQFLLHGWDIKPLERNEVETLVSYESVATRARPGPQAIAMFSPVGFNREAIDWVEKQSQLLYLVPAGRAEVHMSSHPDATIFQPVFLKF